MNAVCIVCEAVRPDFFGLNGGSVRTLNPYGLGARFQCDFSEWQASPFRTVVPARVDCMRGMYAIVCVAPTQFPKIGSRITSIPTGRVGAAALSTPEEPRAIVPDHYADQAVRNR
jgi:hypothetical protein